MSANAFGHLFKITTFGESHGAALGVVIDGCPAGVQWNEELLRVNMNRRKPGGAIVSSRQESDEVKILSGVFEGKTLGTPIAAVVYNQDARSQDYKPEAMKMRQGHATDLWQEKFGHSDPRGSGRASGRETLCRAIAGSVAQMFVTTVCKDATVTAKTKQVGTLLINDTSESALQLTELLMKAKETGESYGGTAEISVKGIPSGLGQPVFRKFKSDLAAAIMSIGATTSVEIGDGFSGTELKGSEFHSSEQNYGGLRGGITTGEPMRVSVAFKPTSTIKDMAKAGRHDPCIIPRALPVLEAMTWLVIADHLLWCRLDRAE
jgi:chorismate synthase